tara:strand:- start:26892 stop:27275 length:384 start_codon:yes stop_codon:yes gene_type:complete
MNFESLTSNLFSTELSKIPEPYRTQFVTIVTNIQQKLESALYIGTAGAGLLTIQVDNHGIIKDVDIDTDLLSKVLQENTFKKGLQDMIVTAHINAVTNAKQALDLELTDLYEKIAKLSQQIIKDKSA